MEQNNTLAIFEAILFAAGEPLEMEKIAQAMECEFDDIYTLYEQLNDRYESNKSGMTLLKLGNKLQLSTRGEYQPYVRAALEIKRNTPLSQAAFEVLAVIAYNQPVTKSFVEQVRGVDCSGVMSSLSEKGLIEERGRLDLPGRPLLYGTTDSFLRCFGLKSLGDLPPIPHSENSDDNINDNDETNENTDISDDDNMEISAIASETGESVLSAEESDENIQE